MSDEAAMLRRLLAEPASSDAPEADMLLSSLPPDTARLLELCAIPHTFDAETVRVLDPSVSEDEAKAFVAEVATLPSVTPLKHCLALHDVLRGQLFRRWLAPARRHGFAAASARLTAHYGLAGDPDSRVVETFHAFGADPAAGLVRLRALFHDLRAARLHDKAEDLLQLIGEYRPALDPTERAWLGYFTAQLESDRDRFELTEALLAPLDVGVLPRVLAARILVLRGAALRRLGRVVDASALTARAQALVTAPPVEQGLLSRIHHELGELARARGDVSTAETEFSAEADIAERLGDRLARAGALNGLANAIQRTDPRRALAVFETIKPLLSDPSDRLRLAALLNNLGRAAADLGLWDKSRDAYEQSLAMKREAADLAGIATTRLNLARVLTALKRPEEARAALTEAAVSFETLRRPADAARARRELARLLVAIGVPDEAAREAEHAAQLCEVAGDARGAHSVRREFRRRKRRRVWVWSLTAAAAAATLAGFLV